jgi:prepilin-type N-terminal cleavage/methylation domain-containing protein
LKNKKKGFTLIELVAVIGLVGIVATIILSVNIIFANGKKIDNVEVNGRLSMVALSQSIKMSKLLVDTAEIRTNSMYAGKLTYDGTEVIPTNMLIAYIETYDNKRYVYAQKGKELHQIILVPLYEESTDHAHDKYKLLDTPTEEKLSESDTSEISNGTQDVVNVSNLTDFITGSLPPYIDMPRILYTNNGDDYYLVVNKPNSEMVKYRLEKVPNLDFKVKGDSIISTCMTVPETPSEVAAVTVENQIGLGTIDVSVTDGTLNKHVKTSINILNEN